MRQAKCSLSHCQQAWTHTAVHLNIMLAHPHCITTFQSCLERKKPWEPFYFFLVWHQKGDYGGDGECRNHLYDYTGKSVITEEKYPTVSELEVTQCGSWTCCQAIQRAGARRATPWCAQTSHRVLLPKSPACSLTSQRNLHPGSAWVGKQDTRKCQVALDAQQLKKMNKAEKKWRRELGVSRMRKKMGKARSVGMWTECHSSFGTHIIFCPDSGNKRVSQPVPCIK